MGGAISSGGKVGGAVARGRWAVVSFGLVVVALLDGHGRYGAAHGHHLHGLHVADVVGADVVALVVALLALRAMGGGLASFEDFNTQKNAKK